MKFFLTLCSLLVLSYCFAQTNYPITITHELESLIDLDMDVVMTLRLVRRMDAAPALVPAEDLVRQSGIPYVTYPLPPLEGQAGPITDLVRARTLLALMQ
ncbi:MAG: hypothetical protein AAF708_15205 [Deinococcota bacterium]